MLTQPLRLRTEPGRKVTWLELFFDLAFVAAVAQVGTPLAHDYTVAGLFRFGFLFLLIWWAWIGHTNFATRFDTDDGVQRVLALIQIFVVAAMAVNAADALDSRSSAGFAAAYAVLRFVLVAQYLRARRIVEARQLTTAHAFGFGAAAVCWLVSALVPPPARFWLWGVALTIDLATPLFTSHLTVRVPPDAAHLPERFGLFTIILLGESLVAVMKGMQNQETWSAAAALSAFLGVSIAFLVWWWYFHGAKAADHRVVRSRRQAASFTIWSFAHLPMYLGIAVAGVGVEHIVTSGGEEHLHAPEAWILCGAVTLFMLALTTIGATSDAARRDPGGLRRRLWQYALAAVPLPLAAWSAGLPAAAVVAVLATICLLQVVLSIRREATHPERVFEAKLAESASGS